MFWARAESNSTYIDKGFNVGDAVAEQLESVILQSDPKERDLRTGEEIPAVQVLPWGSLIYSLIATAHSDKLWPFPPHVLPCAGICGILQG